MSAREELFRRVVGAFVSEDRANKLIDAHRAEVIAERDAQTVSWLGKKAGEFGRSNRENRAASDAVARMADKLSRGAVRDDETGVSELYRLRAENNQLRNDITGACLARYEEEQENERLLKERHSTNEALDSAVREAAELRARVAELEAFPDRAAVLREAADAIVADNDRQMWATKPGKHWAADLLRRMADGKPQRQQEDPHDSVLHHDYALGRDLPAIPHQRDEEAL